MGVGARERQEGEGSFQSCSHGKCFYFLLERKCQSRILKKKRGGEGGQSERGVGEGGGGGRPGKKGEALMSLPEDDTSGHRAPVGSTEDGGLGRNLSGLLIVTQPG